jgi:hypothetical protein
MKTFYEMIQILAEESLSPGTKVKVKNAQGKTVTGKVVRYDKGYPQGSPFYIVDVGAEKSERVPAHEVKKESTESWNDRFKGTAQERRGYLKDWIEANKNFIRVEKGYGECDDCLRIYLDPKAEDEARRSGYGTDFDIWGLWHLNDYGVTSRVSGNAVVLMPRP